MKKNEFVFSLASRHPSPPVLLLAPFHVLTFESLEIPPYEISFPTTNVDDYCILDDEISFSQLTTHRRRHVGNQIAIALLRFPWTLSKPPAPAR
ncbi:hypothetical protein TIFTF001_040298 [Ficus carica]|uniref:Uncharacterized protein n=1 Tax=Ficus carica TaxID=3494 RepID=A0AA88CZJ0_FICCA|nr:hypothetical protein TIFTF001_040056 [Ficus carica]GMN21580.1 hypothetical protein TIFTF001_040059 [Ficus carica]GMN22599.1 hypothetical protein TIFTF001_040295 [Ficus carica]GMN22614.1 hypothetical protein TIFTF001_040298 [Ficus carica]